MDADDKKVPNQLLLAAQHGLLGEVSPKLRGVTIGWSDHAVTLRCYFEGPVSLVDRESMSFTASVIGRTLGTPWVVHPEIVQLDRPLRMECLAAWVYRRREHAGYREDWRPTGGNSTRRNVESGSGRRLE